MLKTPSLTSDSWFAPHPDGVQQLHLFPNSLRLPRVAVSKQPFCIMLHIAVVRQIAWMLCVNGWGRVGRYYGFDMDALREQMGSGWTLLAITVPAWMLCVNAWGRGGRSCGSGMDALRERMGSGWMFLRFRHGCSA